MPDRPLEAAAKEREAMEKAWGEWIHPRLANPPNSVARRDRNYAQYGFDAGWKARAALDAAEATREEVDDPEVRGESEPPDGVMREALGRIASGKRKSSPPGYEHTPMVAVEMQRVARAALRVPDERKD